MSLLYFKQATPKIEKQATKPSRDDVAVADKMKSLERPLKVQSSPVHNYPAAKKPVSPSKTPPPKAKQDGKQKPSQKYNSQHPHQHLKRQHQQHTRSLSSHLQVEYMQASVFTGSPGDMKPFNGFYS